MKKFLNLTNGLLTDEDYDGFVRIQSNHAEKKDNWNCIIDNMDSNYLMYLALGYETKIVDYSIKDRNTRALDIGMEYVWYVCCSFWDLPIDSPSHKIQAFQEELCKLTTSQRRKIKYFRTFVNNPIKPILFSGRATHDDDKEYFGELAKEKYLPKKRKVLSKKDLSRLEDLYYGLTF